MLAHDEGYQMKLAYFTDLHVGLAGEETRGVDVRGNLLKICAAVRQENPDAVVIGGDLCYKAPDAQIYQWVKSTLSELRKPLFITPGNHDDARMLAEVFDPAWATPSGEIYSAQQWNGYLVLFLDSAVAAMTAEQYQWIESELSRASGPVLIFMHHPPFMCAVPYMDENHAFREMDKLQALLLNYPGRIYLFCGHYHVEKTLSLSNVQLAITPSCFFQIDQHQQEFAVDHYQIAYRIIELQPDRILTRLHYLFPAG